MDEIKNLEALRQDIDELDSQLLTLFEERMKTAQEIADYKQKNQLQILDTSREEKVLAKTDQLRDLSLKKYAVDFFQALMNISKALQADRLRQAQEETQIKLGFQGLPGSYSEQAMKDFFGEKTQGKNYSSFEDVFVALQDGEIDYGVLPIENSFTGGISEVYDLLCHYGFYITGEQCVQVDHNLLALEGATLDMIRDVYSHPQAFLQCSQFMKQHPEYNPIPYSNTAVSAKKVADSGDLTQAAIGSKKAAIIYGLNLLAAGINNNKQNYTRFIIIGRYARPEQKNNKISIAVAISHEPGSLYTVLSYFAQHGLNMLKIESRPMADKTWEYLFYIDFDGNLQKEEVRQAVEQIKSKSTYFKLLGNYPANPL